MSTDRPPVARVTDQAALPAGLTFADAERVGAALDASRSPATRRAYASSMRTWRTWCESRGVPAMPASAELLAAWIAELASQGRSVGLIDRHLAAVRAEHRDTGLIDPTSHPSLSRVRAGLRRTIGTASTRQAHALSTDEIRRIVAEIDTDSLRGLRDKALVLVGYAGALRRSELAALRVGDVAWRSAGIVLTLSRSKGDQEGAGQVVGIKRGAHTETDPVAALRAWLTAAELDQPADPIACQIAWSDRRAIRTAALTGESVATILTDRAAAAGLGDLRITGHSLRAGHATTAAEHGVPADRLARTTRHRRLETLAQYVRPASVLGDSTSGDLGL